MVMRCCDNCGKEFNSIKGTKTCSTRCRNKYINFKKKLRRNKHLSNNGPIDYDVTIEKVIERYKGICYLCTKEVDINDTYVIDGHLVYGNNYPSIDHVVPIAKGGLHQWDNVKLAHRICNSKKADKI